MHSHHTKVKHGNSFYVNIPLLVKTYPCPPHQIQCGFDVGIRTIARTFTPENSPTLHAYSDECLRIVDRELSSGLYIGPLSCSEVEQLTTTRWQLGMVPGGNNARWSTSRIR
jgi:hypothetical protein